VWKRWFIVFGIGLNTHSIKGKTNEVTLSLPAY